MGWHSFLTSGVWRRGVATNFAWTAFLVAAGLFLLVPRTWAAPIFITNADELQAMQLDLSADYVLANDIDASAMQSWNEGAGFEPVGDFTNPFTGTFDGGGHTISRFLILRSTESFVGLFGSTLGARISNVRFNDASLIAGSWYVGCFVGYARDTTFDRAHPGAVLFSGSAMGGLCGRGEGIVATHCISTSGNSIVGGSSLGGLVGQFVSGLISDCYSMGTVSGSSYIGGVAGVTGIGASTEIRRTFSTSDVRGNSIVGGLVGGNGLSGNAKIVQSMSLGFVTGTTDVGGLVGMNGAQGEVTECFSSGSVEAGGGGLIGRNDGGPINRSFWDREASGIFTSAGGTGLTTLEMQTTASFEATGWDFTTIWGLIDSKTYPFLLGPEGFVVINTLEELQAMSLNPNGHYILGGDINARKTRNWNGGLGFDPIGNRDIPFTGTLQGENAAINRLFISRPNSGGVGLFGAISFPCYVGDLRIQSASVTGGTFTGIVAGIAGMATVEYVSVSGSSYGTTGVGGAIGAVSGGTIQSVEANCEVVGDHQVGGVVGFAISFAALNGLVSSGTVTGNKEVGGILGGVRLAVTLDQCRNRATVVGVEDVGGVVGLLRADFLNRFSDSVVTNSINEGDVFGEIRVGGFAGNVLSSEIRCSANFGNVEGLEQVGGFIGHLEMVKAQVIVEESFNAGAVLGVSEVGGFVGVSDGGVIMIDSFNVGPVEGDTIVGGFIGSFTGRILIRSYSAGRVSGQTMVGGFAGIADPFLGALQGFWDVDASGQATSAGGTGLSTAEMTSQSTYDADLWDFSTIWEMREGKTYPYLRCSPISFVPRASRARR